VTTGVLTTSEPALAEDLDFNAVYTEHADFAWRSLRRLGVAREHVADATQDVFVVVLRKLDAFEQRSSLKTWLFGIALRVARDYTRRARRRPSEPLPPGLASDSPEQPFEQVAQSEAVALLYRLLEELSEDQRAVFVLVELEQFTVKEAAAAVQANLHTVTSRLKTARQKFEAALRRHQRQP
jgi:RNA polymerase sigma-70 factor, ECF subfamily